MSAKVMPAFFSALREAGFRVTLISSPGELLDRTAAREGVNAIGVPMQRDISLFADLASLVRPSALTMVPWSSPGQPLACPTASVKLAAETMT